MFKGKWHCFGGAAVILMLCSCCHPHRDSVTMAAAPYPGEGPGKTDTVLANLDPDRNGLYDDAERKDVLDALQRECPELQGNFDTDGDGKVTVLEQTQGEHPLSMRVPRKILESRNKIPWAIDLFPEWIMSAYLQEDVAVGPVGAHEPRGTARKTAKQDNTVLQPRKSAERGGVEFAADSGQFFSIPGYRDARWSYRWCLMTFRVDAGTGSDPETILLDLNRGTSSNKSSPKIWYSKGSGLSIQFVGENSGKLDKRIMTTKDVVADGQTWNVLVCGIRYGQMYASVNGVPLATRERQPDRFCGDWPRDTTTYLGDDTHRGNMAWAYDALVFGLTEPSEAMVRKLTGWAAHRLGIQGSLPGDHPYRTNRPILDKEDFPYRYIHDNDRWLAWGNTLKKSVTRVNAGGPPVKAQGFERVFYDDFRAKRISPSTSGEGDLWVGPGFNTAVGGSVPLATPGRGPDAYPYDAENQRQILSLVNQGGRWYGSALYTVNDLGHGYTWKGPKVFRYRVMFPKIAEKDLPGGLFPAFWSYDPDFLFWRTSNRIEVDYIEQDGNGGRWYNGLSTHCHYSHVKNIFAKNPKSYKRYKVYSGNLDEKKGKLPHGGIYHWDGQFHTWEWIIDEDMTYTNVTVPDENGKDVWVEVCRCKTAPTYLERLDLQLDYALRKDMGAPRTNDRVDMVVDFVEVLQKTSAIEAVPEPFAARPELIGDARVGGTVTCRPNLKGVKDIRYYWFADGYPLTYGPRNAWHVTRAEEGKEIRCMVKAVGARDMPEAWSTPISIEGTK